MRRREFVSGSLLAAASAATFAWRARLGWLARAPERGPGVERMPDGRALVRGAALAFGTTVTVAAVHDDPGRARAAVGEALREACRVDALMTVFRPESQVGRLNAEGEVAHPDPHLVRVLELSQRVASLSGGAFDVTVQPLWLLYVECGRRGRLPGPEEVRAARALVDWTRLEVGPRRIALGRPGMSVTLNGVAQGYAADLALGILRERGVADALIDTGEYGAEGLRQPGRPWTLGIQHPRDPAGLVGVVEMDGRFVSTSGDYATRFSDDFLYHHIFDPHTGASPPGLSSAVVAARCGAEADALTKPMMVLAPERARALLARVPGADAVWIDKECRVTSSPGMRLGPA